MTGAATRFLLAGVVCKAVHGEFSALPQDLCKPVKTKKDATKSIPR